MYKVKYEFEEDPKEYKNWLVNDIFGYLNEEVAMMYGLVDNFYTTLMRYYSINDKQTIINIVIKINSEKIIHNFETNIKTWKIKTK